MRRDPVRGLVTVAGLTLGVAVVVAIRFANAASVGGLRGRARRPSPGRPRSRSWGRGSACPRTSSRAWGWLREYGRVSPVIDRNARLETADGVGHRLRGAGGGRAAGPAVPGIPAAAVLAGGACPAAPGAARRPARLLLDRADGAVRAASGHRRRRRPVRLVVGDAVHEMVVRGLLLDEGPARVVDGRLALLDIAAAQWRFDGLGWVDRVEIQLFDASAVDAAERAIAARLPDGLRVQRPAQRGRQVERMLARLPLQPVRAVVDRPGRRPLPGLQHGGGLGDLAPDGDRGAARPSGRPAASCSACSSARRRSSRSWRRGWARRRDGGWPAPRWP